MKGCFQRPTQEEVFRNDATGTYAWKYCMLIVFLLTFSLPGITPRTPVDSYLLRMRSHRKNYTDICSNLPFPHLCTFGIIFHRAVM